MKAIETHNLHKHYKDVRAVDGIRDRKSVV